MFHLRVSSHEWHDGFGLHIKTVAREVADEDETRFACLDVRNRQNGQRRSSCSRF